MVQRKDDGTITADAWDDDCDTYRPYRYLTIPDAYLRSLTAQEDVETASAQASPSTPAVNARPIDWPFPTWGGAV
jgi:hypothetical protein